jgi:hypothetical protein
LLPLLKNEVLALLFGVELEYDRVTDGDEYDLEDENDDRPPDEDAPFA